MPVTVSYPGVYVEEIPSGAHTVTQATTSSTAFAGFFTRGPMNQAVHITSPNGLRRIFGDLDTRSEAGYALTQFFLNGGSDAWVIRVGASAVAASLKIKVLQPTARELSQLAFASARSAFDYARQAFIAVYQTEPADGYSPPASPPGVITDSPPLSEDSPPAFRGNQGDLMTAANAAMQAGQQALAAVGSIRLVAAYADAAATALQLDLGKLDPTLRIATWQAAERAAAAAIDAAYVANNAAIRSGQVADLDDSPPSPMTDAFEASGMTAAEAAHEAAAKAVDAAFDAASAAQDAAAAALAAADAEAGTVLVATASSPGVWGNCLRLFIAQTGATSFDLTVCEVVTVKGVAKVLRQESYTGLTLDPDVPNNALAVVNDASALIQLDLKGTWLPGSRPEAKPGLAAAQIFATWYRPTGGLDGGPPTTEDLAPAQMNGGIYALDRIAPSVFNLLCLPDTMRMSAADARLILARAATYCDKNHAFFIFDMPRWTKSPSDLATWVGQAYSGNAFAAAATYYPPLSIPDPLNNNRPRIVGPSGTMAGLYARTDTQRGVWKAPAGVQAVLLGVDVADTIVDADNGLLNQAGVNVLRAFPVYGPISWGARTLAGADLLDSEWKYINVRRLVDYIEQSLVQSLKWVVFEPNNGVTWGQIRLQVGSFLSGLFADGAFSGASAAAAFFVNCDATTTTADDIAHGIVNIIVGIAPVRPAEFVVLQIQQIAGASA